LVAISEHALGSDDLLAAPAESRKLVVHVDQAVLGGEEQEGQCHVEDGPALSAEAVRQLGCDAEVVTVTEREGNVLNVGRTRRLVSGRLRLALQARDRGCRFPGCGAGVGRSQGHHVQHWSQGGMTDLDNLVLLCSPHHRRLHDGLFAIEPAAEGEFTFLTEDGRRIGRDGRVVTPLGRDAGRLRRAIGPPADGIDATTARALSNGARFDLHHTIDVLCGNREVRMARAGPVG
jgi:hypothetical protein